MIRNFRLLIVSLLLSLIFHTYATGKGDPKKDSPVTISDSESSEKESEVRSQPHVSPPLQHHPHHPHHHHSPIPMPMEKAREQSEIHRRQLLKLASLKERLQKGEQPFSNIPYQRNVSADFNQSEIDEVKKHFGSSKGVSTKGLNVISDFNFDQGTLLELMGIYSNMTKLEMLIVRYWRDIVYSEERTFSNKQVLETLYLGSRVGFLMSNDYKRIVKKALDHTEHEDVELEIKIFEILLVLGEVLCKIEDAMRFLRYCFIRTDKTLSYFNPASKITKYTELAKPRSTKLYNSVRKQMERSDKIIYQSPKPLTYSQVCSLPDEKVKELIRMANPAGLLKTFQLVKFTPILAYGPKNLEEKKEEETRNEQEKLQPLGNKDKEKEKKEEERQVEEKRKEDENITVLPLISGGQSIEVQTMRYQRRERPIKSPQEEEEGPEKMEEIKMHEDKDGSSIKRGHENKDDSSRKRVHEEKDESSRKRVHPDKDESSKKRVHEDKDDSPRKRAHLTKEPTVCEPPSYEESMQLRHQPSLHAEKEKEHHEKHVHFTEEQMVRFSERWRTAYFFAEAAVRGDMNYLTRLLHFLQQWLQASEGYLGELLTAFTESELSNLMLKIDKMLRMLQGDRLREELRLVRQPHVLAFLGNHPQVERIVQAIVSVGQTIGVNEEKLEEGQTELFEKVKNVEKEKQGK